MTELLAVGAIVMRRSGSANDALEGRLRAACAYSVAYTRLDGLAPNVGDNDSAAVLAFDPVPLRDHRPLIGVSAGLFGDAEAKAITTTMPLAVPWLLGVDGADRWTRTVAGSAGGAKVFDTAGVAICRSARDYLFFDGGAFGKRGHGGHGHNDHLSFELMIDGVLLIVDPGCPSYTGDPLARNRFRGTAAHNGARVDGEEIVELVGLFGVGREENPAAVEAYDRNDEWMITGAHGNYRRLADPVEHRRRLFFSAVSGRLHVRDEFACAAAHQVERFLHFAPEVTVQLAAGSASVRCGGRHFRIEFDARTSASIEDGAVSQGYGETAVAPVLVLVDRLGGSGTLEFTISTVRGAE